MSYTYTYSISDDFPDGEVNTSKLGAEISASAIVTALDRIDTAGDAISIVFKAQLSSGDKTLLDGDTTNPAGGLIAAHDNTPSNNIQGVQFVDEHGNNQPTQFDNSGMPLSAPVKPYGLKFNAVSPNWCDQTTWWEESVKCSETLVEEVDQVTFHSPTSKVNWIDTCHGKLFNEDALVDSLGPDEGDYKKLRVRVFVDDVLQTENSPGDTDGDYTINYATGKVVFNNTSASGKQVDAVFWYENGSEWTVTPPDGSKLQLMRVELQFCKDIVLKDSSVFAAYGYVQAYAPQLMLPPYNLPGTTRIPIDTPIKYKSAHDYIDESNGAYPAIAAFGGSDHGGWRASQQDIFTLVWDYVARTDLTSSTGMQLRVSLENDIPLGGSFATVTFYCLRLPED